MRFFLVCSRVARRSRQGLVSLRRAAARCVPLLLLAACGSGAEPPLELTDGWVRSMPPQSGMTAAYGTFRWHGDQPLVITGWQCDGYGQVSLHRTVVSDGVSRMEAVPNATIEPGGVLILERGGLHLMLMQPTRSVQAGDTLGLMLTSDNAGSFRFDLPVQSR